MKYINGDNIESLGCILSVIGSLWYVFYSTKAIPISVIIFIIGSVVYITGVYINYTKLRKDKKT